MTRDQQQATRELERAQENWLRSFGWVREIGGRWAHPEVQRAVSQFDALALTRAQPLIFGSAIYARR